YGVEGEAAESRGSGSVKLSLRIALRAAEDGCTIVYDGTASADGRIKELPADAVESAVTRLLNRFAEQLAAAATRADDDAYGVEGEAAESRGSGSVKLSLRIALRAAEDGCTIVYDGTASAD
ncbi:carbon monoxide dehydrogenase subunit G, partial [Streptomyces sp. WAC04114]|nr:carbon monoxide dehydrogenase subunit G [Streptomyces sp. WAC04114]